MLIGEGNGTPLQYSCLENPMDGGAWLTAVHGVAKSQTRLSNFTLTFYFHALEKEMATHSSVLAWRIPGTGEPGRLPSMGSHRVGHNWSDLAAVVAAAACSWVLSGRQNLLENLLVQKLPGPFQKTSIISLLWGQDFAFTNKFPCAATYEAIMSKYQWNPESVGLTGEWGCITSPSCK